MPRDILLVGRNIKKMISMNAPESDIDQYVTEEGYNPATFSEEHNKVKRLTTQPTQTEEPMTAGGFVGNIPGSAIQTAKAVAQPIIHPIDTGKSMVKLALGTASRFIPSLKKDYAQYANQLGDALLERYGNLENIKKTAYKDPVGFSLDLSTILSGVTAPAKAAGLTKVANITGKAAEITGLVSPVTKLAGKGIQKAVSPYAKKVIPEVRELATKYEIPLMASAISKSPAISILEATAGRGFFGGKIYDRIEQAGRRITQAADDIVTKISSSEDLTTVGKSIVEAKDSYETAWRNTKNQLYDSIDLKPIKVNPQETLDLADKILKKKQDIKEILGTSQDINYFRNIKNRLTYAGTRGGEVSGQAIKSTIRELRNKIHTSTDPIITGNKADLNVLVNAMESDLKTAINIQNPVLGESLRKADTFYQEGLHKLNSQWGKNIEKFRDRPDKILPIIINSKTSVEDIPRMLEVAGVENTPKIQSVLLSEIFKKAKSKTKIGNYETEVFTPTGITSEIKRFGEDKLEKVLTKEQFKSLKEIEILSQAFGKGLQVASGSQTAFIGRIMFLLGQTFTNPLYTMKFILPDVMFSKFVSSNIGQQYLTEGIKAGQKAGKTLIAFAPKTTIPTLATYQAGKIK